VSALEISQLLGNYGEFIGAIAVVVTLVYLSIQVRANTRSTRSQTLLSSSVQYQNLLLAPANSPDLRFAIQKSASGEALSPPERIALASWYNAQMNFLEATWIQADMGAFGRGAEYAGLIAVIQHFLETPGLRSFVESEEHPHLQRGELRRHYDQLCAAAATFPSKHAPGGAGPGAA
jgi:hypothetical protein